MSARLAWSAPRHSRGGRPSLSLHHVLAFVACRLGLDLAGCPDGRSTRSKRLTGRVFQPGELVSRTQTAMLAAGVRTSSQASATHALKLQCVELRAVSARIASQSLSASVFDDIESGTARGRSELRPWGSFAVLGTARWRGSCPRSLWQRSSHCCRRWSGALSGAQRLPAGRRRGRSCSSCTQGSPVGLWSCL